MDTIAGGRAFFDIIWECDYVEKGAHLVVCAHPKKFGEIRWFFGRICDAKY
jgi:hypothetical protein